MIKITEVSLIISILSLIISISWIIISIIWNLKQDKKTKLQLKLPTLKGLYQEHYTLLKDFTERMEFTDIQEKEDFTEYNYRIRNEDGSDYISEKKKKILLYRLENLHLKINIIEGFDTKDSEILQNSNIMRKIGLKIGTNITVPHFLNLTEPDEIKKFILLEVEELAKAKGIKLE